MDIILSISIAIIACFIVHEGGHYAAALCFGQRLEFQFARGVLFEVIPVPRLIWHMPMLLHWKQRIIALAGFGAEIIFALFVWAFYSPVALIIASAHFTLYKFYAGKDSDFKWL